MVRRGKKAAIGRYSVIIGLLLLRVTKRTRLSDPSQMFYPSYAANGELHSGKKVRHEPNQLYQTGSCSRSHCLQRALSRFHRTCIKIRFGLYTLPNNIYTSKAWSLVESRLCRPRLQAKGSRLRHPLFTHYWPSQICILILGPFGLKLHQTGSNAHRFLAVVWLTAADSTKHRESYTRNVPLFIKC